MRISRLIPSFLRQKLNKKIKDIAFSGDNVFCACCEKNFITFLPYGVPKRANALCPGCQSVERQRLIWLYLKEQKELFSKPQKILHFAPEKNIFNTFNFQSNIQYSPVDIDPSNYPEGTKKMNIEKINFDDNYFDVIIASFVLEYVANDRLALKEIRRVLKANGWALIHAFINNELKNTKESDPVTSDQKKIIGNIDTIRRYGKDFKERLEESGFRVKVIRNEYTNEERIRYGLLNEDIYICYKN